MLGIIIILGGEWHLNKWKMMNHLYTLGIEPRSHCQLIPRTDIFSKRKDSSTMVNIFSPIIFFLWIIVLMWQGDFNLPLPEKNKWINKQTQTNIHTRYKGSVGVCPLSSPGLWPCQLDTFEWPVLYSQVSGALLTSC